MNEFNLSPDELARRYATCLRELAERDRAERLYSRHVWSLRAFLVLWILLAIWSQLRGFKAEHSAIRVLQQCVPTAQVPASPPLQT